MARTVGPACAVMCNEINIYTHRHERKLVDSFQPLGQYGVAFLGRVDRRRLEQHWVSKRSATFCRTTKLTPSTTYYTATGS